MRPDIWLNKYFLYTCTRLGKIKHGHIAVETKCTALLQVCILMTGLDFVDNFQQQLYY